jgi:hypothetical protein
VASEIAQARGRDIGEERKMKLVHYNKSPVTVSRLQSANQGGLMPWPHSKPAGFWVSVEGEDGWLEWCLSNEFNLDGLSHVHDVELAATANVLHLSGVDDIDAFTEKFGEIFGLGERDDYGLAGILWEKVAAEHQGIIIAPYIHERRLSMGMSQFFSWYYAWDCACGCIWDVSAIASVTLRETERVLSERPSRET